MAVQALLAVSGLLAIAVMLSHAEQGLAAWLTPTFGLYFKVERDADGRLFAIYVGKSIRVSRRDVEHRRADRAKGKGERELSPFRCCWSAAQMKRIEERRILCLSRYYRLRLVVFPRRPSRLENDQLNRKPATARERVAVFVFLPCYVVESFVWPSRRWCTRRSHRLAKPAAPPVAVTAQVPLPPPPPVPPAARVPLGELVVPEVVGPGRRGPRHAVLGGAWATGRTGATWPLGSEPEPFVPPPGLDSVRTLPPSPASLRIGGSTPVSPVVVQQAPAGPPAVAPPPPVPPAGQRQRKPRKPKAGAQP